MLSYKNNYYYLSILLLGLIVAYWPVSFHVFSLKNDALNYFLPVRRLVSESYFHHILPLWTPYLNMGYPLYGDMQSGVWNPVVQLFSLFGPYNLFTLQLETLLYIYISGAGMFFLLKYLMINPHANMLISFGYMLCGFASDSAQFLNWISALAFLPFIFLYYYRTLHENSTRHAIYSATFVYLMFATAYPADFVITIYVLIAMLIWRIFFTTIENRKSYLKKAVIQHLLMILIFVLLSSPAIISFFQTLPLTERGTGATYDQAMSNPLHPSLLSSFVLPLAAWKMSWANVTDPLLRNSYFGIIPFILLIMALLSPSRNNLTSLLKFLLIFFVLFSFGEYGGIRIIAYYLLPLMDTFRHPANARMFTIFFGCVLAACMFSSVLQGGTRQRSVNIAIAIVSTICVSVLAAAVLISGSMLSNIDFQQFAGFRVSGTAVKNFLESLQLSDVVLASILIQAPFIFLTWKWLAIPGKRLRLVPLSIINCILITALLQPQTVVKNKSAREVQRIINRNAVAGFPIPDLKSTILENSKDGMSNFNEIGVKNLYNKKPGRVDYRITPSNLLTQNKFWSDSNLRSTILKYPLVYTVDSALLQGTLSPEGRKKYVYVESNSLADSINSVSSETGKHSITMSEFLPTRFTLNASSVDSTFIVLLQNNFPAWKLRIDGNEEHIYRVNTTFMGFFVPPGTHTVQLDFEAGTIRIAWWISLIVLAGVMLYRIRYIFP